MSINACIASRGHPRPLRETLMQTLGASTLSTTKAVVALDNDDVTMHGPALEKLKNLSDKIIISMADREDSLGAKYNRAAAAFKADMYVMLTDDEQIVTPDWDKKLEEAASWFPDGIYCICFGSPPAPSWMPAGFVVSHKLMEMMGFFLNPHHPYWWHDTTLAEITHFIGRTVHVDVQMAYPYGYGKTRGCRDVSYWATFFDMLRPARWEIAQRIIDSPENLDPTYRKIQLKQNVNNLAQQFQTSNSALRDPLQARRFETDQAYDAPADERYQRIYAASQKILAQGGVTLTEHGKKQDAA